MKSATILGDSSGRLARPGQARARPFSVVTPRLGRFRCMDPKTSIRPRPSRNMKNYRNRLPTGGLAWVAQTTLFDPMGPVQSSLCLQLVGQQFLSILGRRLDGHVGSMSVRSCARDSRSNRRRYGSSLHCIPIRAKIQGNEERLFRLEENSTPLFMTGATFIS